MRYLESVISWEAVSEPMACTGQAEWELQHFHAFGSYLRASATLQLPDEIERFNEARGYERCFFVDWLALRDYKEGGHTRLNPALRDASGSVAVHAAIDRLTYALKAIALFELRGFDTDVVYRAETRHSSDLMDLQPGDVYTIPSFMSASGQEDIAAKFHKDRGSLAAGEVNVVYEIERASPLAGPMISDLLRDWDYEVLFLPGTRFVVSQVQRTPEASEIKVTMHTCHIDDAPWHAAHAGMVTSR